MPLQSRQFMRPDEAMTAIKNNGFDWKLVREYFRFTDTWLSEGEYARMLDSAFAHLVDDTSRNTLLDMLDLQYAVFLEQVALQDRMLNGPEDGSVAFGERVMAYLQINHDFRPISGRPERSARDALLNTAPGSLISRLLNGSNS